VQNLSIQYGIDITVRGIWWL